jgi:hypothetical protein
MGIVQRETMNPPAEEEPDLFESLPPDHDPFGRNPFAEQDARHEVWNDATRDAWVKLHILRSNLLKSHPRRPGATLDAWKVDLVAAKFDIWAERSVRTVWAEDELPGYDAYLALNANEWMKLLNEQSSESTDFAGFRAALQLRLLDRVEYWKGIARAFVTEQMRTASRAASPVSEWEEIEISFTGDHDAEIRVADSKAKRFNYKDIPGFEDRRTGKPSELWAVLRVFGSLPDSTMPNASNSKKWIAVQKRIERTSKALRQYFGITGDPFPYTQGTGYRARIKIRLAKDSQP